MFSKIVGSTILALVLMQAGVAHAQASSSDAAIAQSLFDEGRKLMAEKKYPEACPRLERSYKLDPAAGTLLNLAVCHEAVGKTATAWNEFRDSVAMARRENRDDRLKFAQAHVDALKGRICTLTVKEAGQEQHLEWKIDGIKVGTESLGIALPIDPGNHTVEAVAPGKKAWKTTIEFHKDGEAKSLEIPLLAVLPPEETEHPVEKSRGPSPWIFVTAGVGVLGFGAMALGGIEALSKWNDRTAACGIGGDPNACSQAGIDADSQARTWALVADIGLGVGVAGTIATIIVAAVGHGKSKEAPPAAHVSFAPVVTPHSAGVALGAVF
jgi:hypothetical protein